MQNWFDPLADLEFEQLECVLLDRHGALLGHLTYSDRRLDLVGPPLRDIVIQALELDAIAVVIAHNHPGGNAQPSPQDVQFTRRLVGVLHPIGIQVRDHLIVTRNACFSFREAGLL